MANKIVWSEGMFLRPHHFQHNDLHLESLIEKRCSAIHGFAWGLKRYQIDSKLLELGKFSLESAEGIFQDGLPFHMPVESRLPDPITVDKEIKNTLVYLALPLLRAGVPTTTQRQTNEITRYFSEEKEIFDLNLGAKTSEIVAVNCPRVRLALESEDLSGYTKLPVARILEVRESGAVMLQPDFIPPVISCQDNSQLNSLISEIKGLLKQRAEALSGRFIQSVQGGSAAFTDFLLLQSINRMEPMFHHYLHTNGTHPEELYRVIISIIGDLATFCTAEKRPDLETLPLYQHDNLTETYLALRQILSRYLSTVLEQSAVKYQIEERQFGIKVARINDRSDLDNPRFVLAVNADLPGEEIRNRLPAQLKIGPVEKIRDLVNNQLPGITVTALPVAPRQIPFHAGYHYFQLDPGGEYWQQMTNSAGFAFHLSGNYPSLTMEFWSIKG
ncbi:type VI secretion system baseplate subunit TssK [Aliikangiella maris]|uniref:Type VI secretion system baseplate subunit TssK n=2 Tax=Aliikangiella maris TaxID=3162458 RepID=A0ABV2BSN6_9GAMM